MKRLFCMLTLLLLPLGLLACSKDTGELLHPQSTAAPTQIFVQLGTPTPSPTPTPTPTPTAVPDITVEGAAVGADATSLTLTEEASLGLLSRFPLLKSVDASAITLDIDTVKSLGAQYPAVTFSFTFIYRRLTLSAADTQIDLSGLAMTGPEEVLEILPYLNSVKKLLMIGCGLTNEQMETLQEARPDVKFVWGVTMGNHVLRTDIVGYSTKNPSKYYNDSSSPEYIEKVKNTRRLYDEDIEVLKYCTDLVALDLGHNYISDISVLENLPKLQILILADNKLTDIAVFEKLPELVYVEIFMNAVTDLSPLAGHDKLLDLNFCNNDVADISVLYSLPQLERVWCAGNAFSRSDGKALQEALPQCTVDYTAKDDTADGWREHARYYWIKEYFLRDGNPYNPS